ncbi:iron-sulfur cluster assembly scaffold protein [Mesorhizobium sp. M0848]|uniref:iron-sulfur cluster assembly scaffold protein n=1 Tax=Mesorhizobium sp. M0848 TaxID=2957012 RepID=UPI00333A584E
MWDYSDKVNFFNSTNAGVLETADTLGEIGAIAYGDALKLTMSIDPKTETITAATWQTFCCVLAIAASAALATSSSAKPSMKPFRAPIRT